jgi:hypothetical protein
LREHPETMKAIRQEIKEKMEAGELQTAASGSSEAE